MTSIINEFPNTSSKLRIKVRNISREDNKYPRKVRKKKSYFIRIEYLINQMINTII